MLIRYALWIAGNDYQILPTSQVITVPVSPIRDQFCVTITINTDAEVEGDEQFELFFQNLPNNYATVGDNETVCVTITDDDGKLYCM